jgi:hypothetical protein
LEKKENSYYNNFAIRKIKVLAVKKNNSGRRQALQHNIPLKEWYKPAAIPTLPSNSSRFSGRLATRDDLLPIRIQRPEEIGKRVSQSVVNFIPFQFCYFVAKKGKLKKNQE